ncbi:MAG: diguanylate cyclase [Arcobacteraceae bacterium]
MLTKAPTILAVDDRKENLDIILDILGDYDVIPVTSGYKALQVIEEEDISLVLLDIVMPELDGFEVCKILKNNSKTKHIPIIFTTAKTDEESIAKAYEAGADDYVSKPLKKAEVIARVKTQLKLKQTIENLEFLASKDSMTGIYNRRKFFELAIPIFKENQSDIFMAMVDIDHFKKVNDTYGHDVGDAVIKQATKTINKVIQPHDVLFARIGGEEFVLLLKDMDKTALFEILENIRKSIDDLVVEHNNHKIKFTISIGATYKTSDTKTIDELLKSSDLALYESKTSGRNKITFR